MERFEKRGGIGSAPSIKLCSFFQPEARIILSEDEATWSPRGGTITTEGCIVVLTTRRHLPHTREPLLQPIFLDEHISRRILRL